MTEPNGIYNALTVAQQKFPSITKSKEAKVETRGGASYSYNYADIADVLAAVRPILNDQGISIVQHTDVRAGLDGSYRHVLVTRIYHTDGSFLQSEWVLRDLDQPQAVGGDLTYFRRYQLSALIGIASEDDDDNARSKVEKPRSYTRGGGEAYEDYDAPVGTPSTTQERQAVGALCAAVAEELKLPLATWMREQGIFVRRTNTTREQLDAVRARLEELQHGEALHEGGGRTEPAQPSEGVTS